MKTDGRGSGTEKLPSTGPTGGHSWSRDAGGSILRRSARWLSERRFLPTSLRAALDHFAATGRLAIGSIQAHRAAEKRIENIIDEAFADVERQIATAFDRPVDSVAFGYETKLTMPVELTLAYVYEQASEASDGSNGLSSLSKGSFDRSTPNEQTTSGDEWNSTISLAESVTELVVVALLDGDIRDAINDGEFEDFAVGFPLESGAEREQIAKIAQSTLNEQVESRFEAFDDSVRNAYEHAVDVSESHQERDPHFRELLERAMENDNTALEDIRAEYKYAEFAAEPDFFTDISETLPYIKTQYGRVGVIYDGMIDMYRAAGVNIEAAFERSIVLSIIGAQIWLDDIDDYERDLEEGQLTPVTAEYLLQNSDTEAYSRIVAISERYFSLAAEYALAADSDLVSIGTRYIYLSGEPAVLPR